MVTIQRQIYHTITTRTTKSILEFTRPNNDQKLPNFPGQGHRDNATCNVFHRQFRHSYQNQSYTISDNRI